jgi:hypothetical protein
VNNAFFSFSSFSLNNTLINLFSDCENSSVIFLIWDSEELDLFLIIIFLILYFISAA